MTTLSDKNLFAKKYGAKPISFLLPMALNWKILLLFWKKMTLAL